MRLSAIKKKVNDLDAVRRLDRCSVKAPLLASVVTKGGSWLRLWACISAHDIQKACRQYQGLWLTTTTVPNFVH